jgi:hypothetical protein
MLRGDARGVPGYRRLTAVGTALSRALGPLGGPGISAALVAGGLAIGALGGGLAVGLGSGGNGAPGPAGGGLPVYGCPGTGSPLAGVRAGQSVLATGRTQDGAWLRIHLPLPGRTEGWVQAAPLQARASIDALPVATCTPELAIAPPSFGPTATLTVPGNFPASAPPSDEPTVTPTPTPTATATANSRPSLTGLTVSSRTISYDTGGYCPTAPKRATFKVKASDDAGVASVALYWRAPGSVSWTKAAMSQVAGNPRSGTWQASLDTTANSIRTAGRLAYYVVATDAAGATRRLPTGGSDGVTVAICRNTGPDITSLRSSSGSDLYWDPLGVGNCQTATNLTAVVKDSDGVKSVTLFYRKHGAGSWSSKPMNNKTIPGRWYANLDTLGDKLPITGPPTDGLDWYVRAVDDLGKASQSSTRRITIRRCDSEANFDGGYPTGQSYPCTTSARITAGIYAGDQDQPSNGLSVTFHWTLTNTRTGAGPIKGTFRATTKKGNYYQGTTGRFDGKTYSYGIFTLYAVTTDRYGGTTKSYTTTTTGMYCN